MTMAVSSFNSKCDHCMYRLECVLNKGDCAITYICDDKDLDVPHPSSIVFNLKAGYAQFEGMALYLWVDEETIRALATMRELEIHDEKQGYEGMASATLDNVYLILIPQTIGEDDAEMRAKGWKVTYCSKCGNRTAVTVPDDLKFCHVCGTPLKWS